MSFSWSGLLLLFHLLGMAVWVGGLITLNIVNVRLGRMRDPVAMETVQQVGDFIGSSVVGPAAGVTVLAGIGMVLNLHMSFATFWIDYGLGGVVASILIGVVFVRTTRTRLIQATAGLPSTLPSLMALRRRMLTVQSFNLLLLVSIVFVMVFKPTI